MSEDQRNEFLAERRVAVIGIGRQSAGPLLAPIWYQFHPEPATFTFCMGGSSAKARRLRAEGSATVCVQAEGYPYRYVTAEGPVTLTPLGDGTYEAIRELATRYLGANAGQRYAEQFSTPDEVMVTLVPQRWQAEIPGPA
jgi:PPOX class probable F420-dependent enzyme